MRLVDFVPPAGIVYRLAASTPQEAIAEIAVPLASLTRLDTDAVRSELIAREQLGSTALGREIAVPHARMSIAATVGVLGLSATGVGFESPDGLAVRILVGFVSPLEGGIHLKALATVGKELADGGFRGRLLAARSAEEIYALLSAVTA